MRTTFQHSAGGLEAIADQLTDLLLQARQDLPRTERNGRGQAADPYTAQVRREMRQRRSREIKRLLAVLLADLSAGVTLPRVAAPLRQMLAYLEVVAAKRHGVTPIRSIRSLMRRETKTQSVFDLAELRATETPLSREAILELRRAGEAQMAVTSEIVAACDQHLVEDAACAA